MPTPDELMSESDLTADFSCLVTVVRVADYPPVRLRTSTVAATTNSSGGLRGSATWSRRFPGSWPAAPRDGAPPGPSVWLARGCCRFLPLGRRPAQTHAYVHFHREPGRRLPARRLAPVRSAAERPRPRRDSAVPAGVGHAPGEARLAARSHQAGRRAVGTVRHGAFPGTAGHRPALGAGGRRCHGRDRGITDGADGPVAIRSRVGRGAGVSTGHLFRIFRREYGAPRPAPSRPSGWRGPRSCLQRSNATVAEIAHRSGFANPYHFSRRFAAVYDKPPGRYRQSACRPTRCSRSAAGG